MTKSKTPFPNALGGLYRFDPDEDLFIPGVDGEPEFPSQNQKWRAIEEIDESDVESVMREGVILPVVVRKRKDGRAEVVDGRQRSRWARLANKRLREGGGILVVVPGRLEDFRHTEAKSFGRTMETNYHRIDPSPMQQAEDAASMLILMGESDIASASKASIVEVASRLRCSPDKVRNLIKLRRLTHEVQTLVGERRLQMTAALTLVDLDDEEQNAKAQEIVESGFSAAEVIERSRKSRDGEAKPGPKGLRRAQIVGLLRVISSDLEAGAGAGCDIPEAVVDWLRVIVGTASIESVPLLPDLLHRTDKE